MQHQLCPADSCLVNGKGKHLSPTSSVCLIVRCVVSRALARSKMTAATVTDGGRAGRGGAWTLNSQVYWTGCAPHWDINGNYSQIQL